MMQEDKSEQRSPGADLMISEFSSNSLYNTPGRTAGEKTTWITPEPAETKCINGTVFEVSPIDLSRPSISKRLALSKAAVEAFDDDMLLPVLLVPRILCVGMACVDVALLVDEFPTENQKTRASGSVLGGGGNAANTGGTVPQRYRLITS